jgi:hypothetical protein
VLVKNVRNYRYSPTEADMHPGYYDRSYNLNEIKQVWYISEPFANQTYAAHTFLSFEFYNGDFLAISIEARKVIGQDYSVWKGFLRTYPLMYVAADERDVVLLRANIRKDDVYVYPVKLSSDNARLLLTDMLQRMNTLQSKPAWYNTLTDNCTSAIVYHINRITPGRLPNLSWQLLLTGYADRYAIENGLLQTDLPYQQARNIYRITTKSQAIGDAVDYSQKIRQFDAP